LDFLLENKTSGNHGWTQNRVTFVTFWPFFRKTSGRTALQPLLYLHPSDDHWLTFTRFWTNTFWGQKKIPLQSKSLHFRTFHVRTGLLDFFWCNIPKRENVYQIDAHIPNGHKLNQMAINYTKYP
jgi:hypothetical protein